MSLSYIYSPLLTPDTALGIINKIWPGTKPFALFVSPKGSALTHASPGRPLWQVFKLNHGIMADNWPLGSSFRHWPPKECGEKKRKIIKDTPGKWKPSLAEFLQKQSMQGNIYDWQLAERGSFVATPEGEYCSWDWNWSEALEGPLICGSKSLKVHYYLAADWAKLCPVISQWKPNFSRGFRRFSKEFLPSVWQFIGL